MDKKAAAGAGLGINSKKGIIKAEHPEWYSATGSLGLRDFQIDDFGVKDAEMERHFVAKMDSETINKLDDLNRRDMRNWSDSDEDD